MVSGEKEVRVFAPATVANVGPGFDILGMAVQGPGDTVVARRTRETGVRIAAIEGDGGTLPLDAGENTAGIAARATLQCAGIEGIGVELEIHKGLPLGSGLGSSAASAAAAAMATNLLVGSPLRKQELVEPCLVAESEVSGRHADNVAPALLGGMILVRSVDPMDFLRVPLPAGLLLAVATPLLERSTKEARRVLPEMVPFRSMVRNTANLATLIAACFSGDVGLMGRGIGDEVVTMARAHLIPGCEGVIRAAEDAGALFCSISGAGPSMFAFCYSRRSAQGVAAAMVAAFRSVGEVDARAFISPADCPGARCL
jgi:homoserine kinase